MTMTDSAQTPANGLVVHRSAWVERLVDPLVTWLDRVADDPLRRVSIVVQSQGMRRWLTHRLAERIDPAGGGILANVAFEFPGSLIDRIIAACMPDAAAEIDAWDPDRLAWHVARIMTVEGETAPLATITRGLADDRQAGCISRRTWRLARSVADVVNGYILHRPDVIAQWSAGRFNDSDGGPLPVSDHWQPWLWRRLVAQLGDPIEPFDAAVATLTGHSTLDPGTDLPRDVAIFGLSTLPPRHLDLIAALARHTTVEWFVPTPSPARWRTVATAAQQRDHVAEAHHPLLVASGRLIDDTAQLVARHDHQDRDHDGDMDRAHREDVTSLLAVIQQHLLADATLPSGRQPLMLQPADRSITLHSCHGPARQAEALRDGLLGLLDDDPTLEPRDIIVLAPDVEMFAPVIQQAFAPTVERPGLPVRVADRQAVRSDPVVESLMAIIRLADGRLTATEVLDVLARPLVARRAGLDRDDLARLSRWVADAGINWGIDRTDRERAGQPSDRHHTWEAGLDRLMLGIAMADEDDRIVGDVVPYDHMEGDDVEVLGRCVDACRRLFAAVSELRTPTTPRAWRHRLTQIASDLLTIDADERWRLLDIDDRLAPLEEVDDLPVDLSGVEALLTTMLEHRRGAAGYETGSVTLCELVPMRSIPHRVVCLVGLDDGAYPRRSNRPSFDLVGRQRRLGDRDRRDEDRHLFLEAVLAVREHLIITTTGRDARTNEPRPPAVVVAELIDVIDRIAQTSDGTPASAVLTVNHPLHAFSPREFDGAAPRSFDPQLLAAARVLAGGMRQPHDFLDAVGPVDVELAGDEITTVDGLARVVAHPLRAYMEDGLGLRLVEWRARIGDVEPLTLDLLLRADLARAVMSRMDDPQQLERWARAVIARGVAPAASPGNVAVGQLVAQMSAMIGKVAGDLTKLGVNGQASPLDHPVDLVIGDRRLVGRTALYEFDGMPVQVIIDPRVRRPARRLEVWVRHLAVMAVFGRAVTIAAFRASGSTMPFDRLAWPDDAAAAAEWARDQLERLFAIHDEAKARPVMLFEHASAAFAEHADMHKAAASFSASFGAGDLDTYVEQAFGVDATLESIMADADRLREFQQLAQEVWVPFLASRKSRVGDLAAALTA